MEEKNIIKHIAEGYVVSISEIEIKKERNTNVCHIRQKFSIDLFGTGNVFENLTAYDGLVLRNPIQIGDKIRCVFVSSTSADGKFEYKIIGYKKNN